LKNDWYEACKKASAYILPSIPEPYLSRTFSGIIGDIKALTPKKALSLISRKKGLGLQYSFLYLDKGIDSGMGYQACAAEALVSALGKKIDEYFNGRILDAGCSVGVTAGILGLNEVTGFDIFPDLLKTATLVDSFSGKKNYYVAADMTRPWPFGKYFDTVSCCLVCHHLKEQPDVQVFFRSAFSCLEDTGKIVITLPSGSVSNYDWMDKISKGLKNFGFTIDRDLSGLVKSTDNSHSIFWMFIFAGTKTEDIYKGDFFIDRDFGFSLCRTPESRVEKGIKAKETSMKERLTKHTKFRLITMNQLENIPRDKIFMHATISEL
jgi:SAM-dependent methyltransferase